MKALILLLLCSIMVSCGGSSSLFNQRKFSKRQHLKGHFWNRNPHFRSDKSNTKTTSAHERFQNVKPINEKEIEELKPQISETALLDQSAPRIQESKGDRRNFLSNPISFREMQPSPEKNNSENTIDEDSHHSKSFPQGSSIQIAAMFWFFVFLAVLLFVIGGILLILYALDVVGSVLFVTGIVLLSAAVLSIAFCVILVILI